MKSLQHYWYHPNKFVWLLLPLSWLYCFIIVLRRKLYQLKLKKSYASAVPVVVIGNIVAGGSGKTPLLISLCKYIQAQGYNPGVVSRGYGGKVSEVHQVSEQDSPALVGDEPLMICQRTQVPVVVGIDRVAAVNHLLKNNRCDIVFSDDGLQHYRMQRNYEIVVIDAEREFGNGFCLPAGPLRERVSRLNEANMLVYNGAAADDNDCSYVLEIVSLLQLNGGHLNAGQVNGGQVSSGQISNGQKKSIASFSGQTVHAVAGIAHPTRFFKQLKNNGLDTINHAYPDHHVYQQQDFSGWQTECIIMTEKDAVKCRHLILPDAWVMVVEAVFSAALNSRLSAEVLPLLKG